MMDIKEYFKKLRFDKNHHLGLGDIRLTIAQQEEIEQEFEELKYAWKKLEEPSKGDKYEESIEV